MRRCHNTNDSNGKTNWNGREKEPSTWTDRDQLNLADARSHWINGSVWRKAQQLTLTPHTHTQTHQQLRRDRGPRDRVATHTYTRARLFGHVKPSLDLNGWIHCIFNWMLASYSLYTRERRYTLNMHYGHAKQFSKHIRSICGGAFWPNRGGKTI